MRHKEIFKTYVWLVDTLLRFGPLTLDEIGARWQRSSLFDGNPMARTSFNRYRDDIEDVFGIRIICSHDDGWRYSIDNVDEMNANSVQSWMANTLSINNIITENRSVQDRIILESIPSEGPMFQTAIEAMKHSRMLALDYRKYKNRDNDVKHYEVEPYCVKLYHRRWYILVRLPERDQMRVLSFDRIIHLEMLKKKFRFNRKFDANAYFSDCYGVYRSEEIKAQRIVVRAYDWEQFALRDLPIHPSQRKIADGGGWTDYEMTLRPSSDFLGFLLLNAQWVKVISPQSVIDALRQTLSETRSLYE